MTLQDLTRRIGEFGETPFTLALRFGEYDLAIVSNSGPIIEKLRNIYPSFVDDAPRSRFVMTIIDAAAPDLDLAWSRPSADASDDESDEELCDLPDGRIIRRRSKGIMFASGDAMSLAILPCAKHGNKLVNFINSRYIQWQLHQGGVLAHASSVASDLKGLVLAGAASSGKTTLAFHLLDRGFRLIGKDSVIVRRETPGLRMYGTPAPPRVNPGTALHSPRLRVLLDAAYAQKLEQLSRKELWGIEKKHEVFVEELYGAASTRMDGAVDGIVVLNWQHDAGPIHVNRVDLGRRQDLLTILMKSRGRFYWSPAISADPEPGERAYMGVFGDCAAYEITGGIDFDQAASFCARLL